MALYFNLPVYKDSYELLLMIFQNSSKLPKNYKYTLGERLKNEATEVLVAIFEASQSKDKNKAVAIQKALNSLEKCRLFIRILKDLNIWGISKQANLNQKIESISKQLTQWSIHTARVLQ